MNDLPPPENNSNAHWQEMPRRVSPAELMEMSLADVPQLNSRREDLLHLCGTRSGMRPRHLHELIRRSADGA